MFGLVTSGPPSVPTFSQNRSSHCISGLQDVPLKGRLCRTYGPELCLFFHLVQRPEKGGRTPQGAMSRAGKPTDIPVSEVLNGCIKAELYNSGRPGNWKGRICFRTGYRSSSKTGRRARSDAVPCSRISCGCVSASMNEIGKKSLDLSTIGTGSSRKDPAVSAFTDSYIYRL